MATLKIRSCSRSTNNLIRVLPKMHSAMTSLGVKMGVKRGTQVKNLTMLLELTQKVLLERIS